MGEPELPEDRDDVVPGEGERWRRRAFMVAGAAAVGGVVAAAGTGTASASPNVDGGSASTQNDLIQIRRGNAADWSANTVLDAGELGVELDTGRMKLGDSSTAWSALPYVDSGAGSVLWVSAAGSDTNVGDGPGAQHALATIQAAVTAIEALGGANAGVIYVLAGEYEPFTVTNGNVTIVGLGGRGAGSRQGQGSVRVVVPDGDTGASCRVGASSVNHQGVYLANLAFVDEGGSSAGSGIGIDVGNYSNFRVINCGCDGFKTGAGIKVSGSPTANASQYGVISDCVVTDCQTGIDLINTNGCRVVDCYLDSGWDGTNVVSGTIGILVEDGSDTTRITDCCVQFFETLIKVDADNVNTSIMSCRFEAFGTGGDADVNGVVTFDGAGVDIAGKHTTFGPGCTFNNYIVGTNNAGRFTGQCVHVESSAADTRIYPFECAAIGQLSTAAGAWPHLLVWDEGDRTDRRDTYKFDAPLGTISATTTKVFAVCTNDVIAAVNSVLGRLRNIELMVGTTTIPNSSTDYWSMDLKRRASNGATNTIVSVESQDPAQAPTDLWPAFEVVTAEPPGPTDYAVGIDEILMATFTKHGSPPDLTEAHLHVALTPW